MTPAVLHLAPGTGLVVRRPTALLYSARPDPTLVEAFGSSEDGAELHALASATVGAGFAVQPFVGVSWDSGLRVMTFGDIAVETDQPSLPMISGAASRTWVEHTVALGDHAVVDVAGEAADPATDLVAGTVFAGGFRLELGETGVPASVGRAAGIAPPPTVVVEVAEVAEIAEIAEPPDATTSVPRPDVIDADDPVAALLAIQAAAVGADGEPLEPAGVPGARVRPERAPPSASTVDRTDQDVGLDDPGEHTDADVTLPPPASDALLADVRRTLEGRGPLVEAKPCANGHANPSTAATCAVCGEFLAPGTAAVVHVARPSLGRLQFDDGELVDLDQELLVGRNPDRDTAPARAALRRVKTLGEKVSRSHLEVRFQDWDVLVSDCGSTNGTFVVPHQGGQVVALEPGRPQIVEPGAIVYFGSRSFTVLGREAYD